MTLYKYRRWRVFLGGILKTAANVGVGYLTGGKTGALSAGLSSLGGNRATSPTGSSGVDPRELLSKEDTINKMYFPATKK